MNTEFENSKTMAAVATVLLLLSIVPYVGWVIGIVGIILLMKSMKEFSSYYRDPSIYQNAWTGIKYYIVALVAIAVAGVAAFMAIAAATAFTFEGFVALTAGFSAAAIIGVASLIVAFVFYVLAATHLKNTLNTLAEKTGETSLATAGTLLWIGAILTIVGVGLILIFVSWIFATVGFFSMKNQQVPPYSQTPYAYTPPTQPAQPARSQTPV
ncbi:MAG: DUF996 domain-containing protein [Candidatus Bathyarchaeota archaeon]|nr:DUF996 domain-containing protein [Candidatus Bathyarchaeota archaeon]